jgi:hypothetical protein
MLKKSDIKNKELLNFVPVELKMAYKQKFKKMLESDNISEGTLIFTFRQHSLKQMSFRLRKLNVQGEL